MTAVEQYLKPEVIRQISRLEPLMYQEMPPSALRLLGFELALLAISIPQVRQPTAKFKTTESLLVFHGLS